MTQLIEIVSDGGPTYGMGHLYRSGELGRYLAGRGYRVRVRSASTDGEKILPNVPREKGDAKLVVIDLPYDGADHVDEARNNGLPVLALDYHGTSAPDLAVCLFDDSGVPAGAPRVVGLEYSIIRSDVLAQQKMPEETGVLIMIGGGDIRNCGIKAAQELCNLGEMTLLVRGPLNSPADNKSSYENLRILDDPQDLVDHMAGCSWAVSNGGTSMLELMRLGKAIHVIAQTPQERNFAEGILKQGGILGVGDSILGRPDEQTRRRVGEMAASLVDGRGLERITGHIEELLN
ncbi:MAG: hypothetical protein ISR45_06760 [Rhodospirillales bacterium]|nr:hypothetical protein [Rhodospirillales bacterium]